MWENLLGWCLSYYYFELLYMIFARFSPPPSASSPSIPARLVVLVHLEIRRHFPTHALKVVSARYLPALSESIKEWLVLLSIIC